MPDQTSTPPTGINSGSPSARMDDHWELFNAPRFEFHDVLSGTTTRDQPNRSDSPDPTTGPDSGRLVNVNGDYQVRNDRINDELENQSGGLILSNYLPSAPVGYWDQSLWHGTSENALDAVVGGPISMEEVSPNGYELSNNTPSAHVNERFAGTPNGDTHVPDRNHGNEQHGASRGRNNAERTRRRGVHHGRVAPSERMTPEATAEFWRGISDNEREDDNGDASGDTDGSMNRDATGNDNVSRAAPHG
ncbi:hypothetical protein DM02DRAFT_636321 [Periconia macrospinosa]|uniref:Uncharacterized protein n=1 Tax=Periconia macrospinosa TaxID=97972 RepID=A0A2V1CZJ7_9PLEO|nr:hypothetical protein DM02DRAFT_636321 [Periconia macrospinosa]